MSSGHVEATCYLQVEPEWYLGTGAPRLTGAKVVRMTQRRPMSGGVLTSAPGTVIIQLTVRVPRIAYDVPAVTVELPEREAAVEASAVVAPTTTP